ncbi:hypothetical protein [Rhizobium hidalgonense]|nr:hypothetical protein [Rhizobium hidalgonense]MDR9804686.1 hypothetical protein [Rhizobium hidalgonense]
MKLNSQTAPELFTFAVLHEPVFNANMRSGSGAGCVNDPHNLWALLV